MIEAPTPLSDLGQTHADGARRAWRRGLVAISLALAAQLAPVRVGGWWAQFEARAKVVATVALVVSATLLHDFYPVACVAVLALALTFVAGLRGRELAPVWLGAPLFTLALALPAMLNVVTPGPVLLPLGPLGLRCIGPWALPDQISVTVPGVMVASRFFLRTMACVTLTLTLTATTPPSSLVSALRRLGMPRLFGMVLTMMQRYLALVLQAAEDLHLAHLSRTLGGETIRQGQRRTAAGIGLLLLSSLRLAEGVHDAMMARGYDGDIRSLEAPRWSAREWLLVACAALLATGMLLWDRVC